MRSPVGARLLAAMLLSCGFAAGPPRDDKPLARYSASRISMACEYAIDAYGRDAADLPRVLDEALDEVDRIDRLMSHYKADSPLSRINREAASRPVAVEPELFDFIASALRYSRDSDGAFDVTVGPLMKTWGFFGGEGRVPSEREIADVRGRVGAAHVILDPARRTIAFDARGVELDLGGIAKGYAVDRIVDLFRRRRISAALVSAGGSTIYALGAPPGRDAWPIAIQDPIDSRKTAFTLHVADRAVSVAGRSEKSFEEHGVVYSHIMDPRTGRPAQGVLAVVVLAPTGTEGDALDDAFFVLGPERSRAYANRLRGAEAIFFVPDSARGWTVVPVRGTT